MQYTKDPLSWNSSFMGVTVTMEEIQSGVQSGASTLYTLAPECNILHFCPSHPFLCHYPPQFSGSYIYLFSNDPYMVLTLVIASYFVLSLALVLRLTCISCHLLSSSHLFFESLNQSDLEEGVQVREGTMSLLVRVPTWWGLQGDIAVLEMIFTKWALFTITIIIYYLLTHFLLWFYHDYPTTATCFLLWWQTWLHKHFSNIFIPGGYRYNYIFDWSIEWVLWIWQIICKPN